MLINTLRPHKMDDKGLDLSLGLPCGGSSSNPKDGGSNSNSALARTDTDERTSKILNDFRNFLNAGIPQSLQQIDQVKPEENIVSNVPQTATSGNGSGNGQVLGDNKRKNTFGEINNLKKQETDTHSSDLRDSTGKTSHISITTDEDSTADNEDIAESEAEGSTSRVASHKEERSSTPVGSSKSYQTPTEVHGKSNVTAASFLNKLNVPYLISIKESPTISTPNSSSYPLSSLMPGMTSTNGGHCGPNATSSGSVPMTFGYSPPQIPVLTRDSTWGMIARPQPLNSPYTGSGISTSVALQGTTPASPHAVRPDVHLSEQSRGQTKQLVAEEGSSSQTEEDTKGRANTFASDYPSIKPGIAPDIKFGGSGSFPKLPWVSTTGPGPNGKTISGVTYKYSATEIKIVCACHGTHMTPEEFIRHASEDPQSGPSTPRIASLPSSSPAASAKS